jgi:hypothetical protein
LYGKALRFVLGFVEEPLAVPFVNEHCRLRLDLSFLKFVSLLERMFDRVAADEMAELCLVHGTALLLLHYVVPCANVRLAFDENGNTWLNIVVVQHRGIVFKK